MKRKKFFQVSIKTDSNEVNEQEPFDNSTVASSENFFQIKINTNKKRLNAYDTELFEKNNISNDYESTLYKINSKINKLKQELIKIDEKIAYAEKLKEEIIVRELQIERFKITKELENLKEISHQEYLPYTKLISNVAVIVGRLSKIKKLFGEKINCNYFRKIIKKLPKHRNIDELILKFKEINEYVTELSNTGIPYGEENIRYYELSKYLTQATAYEKIIDNEINGNIHKTD